MPASRRQCVFKSLGGIGDRRRAAWRGDLGSGDPEYERQKNAARGQVRAHTRARIAKDRIGKKKGEAARTISYCHFHDFAWRRISERFAVKLDLGITCLQP